MTITIGITENNAIYNNEYVRIPIGFMGVASLPIHHLFIFMVN